MLEKKKKDSTTELVIFQQNLLVEQFKLNNSCVSDGSCWEIIIIKQIHTLKQNVAGGRVDLLDENNSY